MSIHVNRRLFDLATRNQQRLDFAEHLRLASAPFRAIAERSRAYFHPDTPGEVKAAVSASIKAHDRGLEGPVRTRTTKNRESAHSLVKAALARLPDSAVVFLHFGGSSTVAFDGAAVWVPKYPVLQLSRTDAAEILGEALNANDDSFCLATGAAFVALDSYMGGSSCGVTYEFAESSGDA